VAAPLTGISSMATRQLLTELAATYEQAAGVRVAIESVGGVDAARRVQAGEPFDAAFLASDAIDRLAAAGRVVAGSRVDLARSPVAVAVRAGERHPDLGSEAALREAVRHARAIGYSTGPSGTYLLGLFDRWGLADEVRSRIVQAPPGVPVGALVARGEVELGFQQLGELMHLPGIDVVGPLPPAVQFVTTFSGALCTASTQPDAVRAMLDWMASAAGDDARARQGMEPARNSPKEPTT